MAVAQAPVKTVNRIDSAQIKSWEMTPNGYILARVIATRIGTLTYEENGILFREYRPREEVFKPESYKTLDNTVLTDGHPPEMLNPENTKLYQRGYVTGPTRPLDDKYLETWVLITDQDLIEKVKAGLDQVSCGYKADVIEKHGFDEYGVEYDFVQTNIRYNHLSRVDRGRAGPDVRIRFDCAVEVDDEAEPAQESAKNNSKTVRKDSFMETSKIRLDGLGIEVEVPASAASSIAAEIQKHKSENLQLKDSLQKSQEKFDGLNSEHSNLQGKYEQAKSDLSEANKKVSDQERTDSEIKQLVNEKAKSLAATANAVAPFLNQGDRLDDLDEIGMKKLALSNRIRNLPKDRDDSYYEGRFDELRGNFMAQNGMSHDFSQIREDGFVQQGAYPNYDQQGVNHNDGYPDDYGYAHGYGQPQQGYAQGYQGYGQENMQYPMQGQANHYDEAQDMNYDMQNQYQQDMGMNGQNFNYNMGGPHVSGQAMPVMNGAGAGAGGYGFQEMVNDMCHENEKGTRR